MGFWSDYGQGLNLETTETGVETGFGPLSAKKSDRETYIMPIIENFGFWSYYGLDHSSKFQLIYMCKSTIL
jgi:hypothetical protein